MLKRSSLLWGLLPLVALVGCAQQKKETWVNTTESGYTTGVPEGRSSIVFYRQADAVQGPTVNIYVNGQYSGSLQPNAYRQELVCAQNQKIHADFTRQDAAYYNKEHAGDYYDLPESAVSFFKIVDNGRGRPALQNVSPEQAEEEMKGIKRQNHTLSRVTSPEKCAQILKKYSLQSSALFKFDRSGYNDMLEKGKQEVAAISADIKQNPDHVTGIEVIGHTDPEGTPAYNSRLSSERAATVKQALSESGLNPKVISAQGRGEQQLLVANCRKRFPKNAQARQECDQPNRRVEIILHGEK
ncbi:OmpA family protein [Neisseria chenwenguii]|uniref:Cell envelope biogenesis protein OmpA n=1 Tax=Neisseria chenwenguii TaxID=1853278 RepID=A0A220S453_9NEIS|nr:OmpA family protein [Neisseria chenwenguii]ASK27985.1 cell envelope biogenesis protein OmpA [Neisseria chenwenguii]ROV54061.1 cell envelope biogenesis protein OmpA [Neisseria chenwenguii]